MNLEFVKQLYQFELERKEHLAGALNLPAGLLVVIGGFLAAIGRDFSYVPSKTTTVFATGLVVGVLSFAYAVYNFARSYVGHSYGYIPCPRELQDFYDGLVPYHRDANSADGELSKDFDDFLRRRYLEAADRSTTSNDSKAAFLHRGNQSLTVLLCATAMCAVPYVLDVRSHDQIQKVEITNISAQPIGAPMPRPTTDPSPSTRPSPAPTSHQPGPAPRPAEPQIRVLKEGTQPPKRGGC